MAVFGGNDSSRLRLGCKVPSLALILLPFGHTQPDTDLLLLPKRAMAY
jgi:hypothetical protein